jgi:hypothetical protein
MNRQVLFHCGHVEMSNILGDEEAQAKRIGQLESGDCKYCWLKKKAVQTFAPLTRNASRSYLTHPKPMNHPGPSEELIKLLESLPPDDIAESRDNAAIVNRA